MAAGEAEANMLKAAYVCIFGSVALCGVSVLIYLMQHMTRATRKIYGRHM